MQEFAKVLEEHSHWQELVDGEDHLVWDGLLANGQPYAPTDQVSFYIREAYSGAQEPYSTCGFSRCVTQLHVLHLDRAVVKRRRNDVLKDYLRAYSEVIRGSHPASWPSQLHSIWQHAYDSLRAIGFTKFNAIRVLQKDAGECRRIPAPLEPPLSDDALLRNIRLEAYRVAVTRWQSKWDLKLSDEITIADDELRVHEPPLRVEALAPMSSHTSLMALEQAVALALLDGETPAPGLLRLLETERRKTEQDRLKADLRNRLMAGVR